MVHSRVKHLSLIAVVFVWNSVEYILDCININMVAICTKKFRKKTHIFYHSWFFYWNILVLFIINSMNSSQWKVFAFQQWAFFHHLHTSLFSFLFSLICLYTKTPLAVKILSPVAASVRNKKKCIYILFNCVHIACCQGKTISCSNHGKNCLFCNHSAKRVFICRNSNWNMFEYLNCHRSK